MRPSTGDYLPHGTYETETMNDGIGLLCDRLPGTATVPANRGFGSCEIPSLCDDIDFNNDGLFPDTVDIDDFLSVFSGGSCTNDPNCGDIDFNNDGLFPDTPTSMWVRHAGQRPPPSVVPNRDFRGDWSGFRAHASARRRRGGTPRAHSASPGSPATPPWAPASPRGGAAMTRSAPRCPRTSTTTTSSPPSLAQTPRPPAASRCRSSIRRTPRTSSGTAAHARSSWTRRPARSRSPTVAASRARSSGPL